MTLKHNVGFIFICQNIDESEMMGVMVKLSVQWMQMGLPLQLLKIVVYSRCPDDPQEREQGCVQVFNKMKEKAEMARNKGTTFRVCLHLVKDRGFLLNHPN